VLRRAALILVLVLAGCGDPRPGPVVPAGSASAPPSLTEALLTVDDLPAGWTPGPHPTHPEQGSTGCPPYDALDHRPRPQAEVLFSSGDGRAQWYESILATTEPDAGRAVDAMRQIVEQCRTVTTYDGAGGKHVSQVSEVAGADQIRLGEDSYTLRFGSESALYDTTVAIRQGGILLTVASFTETAQSPLLAEFAADAYAKMRRTVR